MLCQTTAMLAWQGMAPLARPTSVGSVDSTVRPVRCHWHDAAYADRCTELLHGIEDAWAVQVDEMGFPAPVPDSDGILDVYIDGGASAFGAYAYGPSVDADTSDDRMSSAAYIAIHVDYEEDWRWTMLHEFNHVLQYATDFTEPRYVPWEGTATAAEIWTDPTLEVVPETIADFQLTPWVGLLGDSWQLWDDYEIWSYYEYGSALWLQFLDAEYGDGAGSAGVDLWLNSAQAGWVNEPDFLDASGQWTGDWQTPLMDFSLARARLGTDDAPDWGANLGEAQMAIGVDASFSSDELPATLEPAMDPFQTGAVYGEVRGLEPGDELALRAEGEAGVRWGLLVVDGTDGTWTEADTLTWTVNSAEVVVGVVHLGGMDFDADEVMATSPVSLLIGLNGASPVRSDGGDTGVGAGGGVGTGAKGCTCAAGSLRASGLAWWALLALSLSRRRDRATARPDAQTMA